MVDEVVNAAADKKAYDYNKRVVMILISPRFPAPETPPPPGTGGTVSYGYGLVGKGELACIGAVLAAAGAIRGIGGCMPPCEM